MFTNRPCRCALLDLLDKRAGKVYDMRLFVLSSMKHGVQYTMFDIVVMGRN